jgi:uncharacterized protein YdaU (DUF1376 family)
MPWFKMYPEAYLEGTRKLTPEQRGIYSDCLMLLYKHDKPLPKNDAWMACELHVNVKVWRRVRDLLLSLGKLIEMPDGYINNRAAIECEERLKRRSNKVASQLQLGLQLGSKPTATELQTVSDPGLPSDNNDRPPKLHVIAGATSAPNGPRHACARARASDHQIIEEEKDSSSSDAPLIDDDPLKRRRTLPSHLVMALANHVGTERAQEIADEYMGSEFGRGAKVFERAFPAWVLKVHKINIDAAHAPTLAAEIIALCGTDASGKLDLSLPKRVSQAPPPNKGRAA